MTTRRLILLHISDSHGGHKHGLLNPATILEDEDPFGNLTPWKPALTEYQRYLWYDIYQPAIDRAVEIAAGDEVIPLHTGDPIHGDKHPEHLISTRKSDQVEIGVSNMRPALRQPNVLTVRLAASTGAHAFGEGSGDILIARQLAAEFPKTDIKTVQHGLASIASTPIDYSHHGPYTGSRNWLKGNSARYYLRDLMMEEIMQGNRPPTLVLRGHYHDPIWETVRIWYQGELITSHIIIAPPLCGLSYWTHQAVKSKFILRAGVMIYELVDGKLVDIYPIVKTLDIRTKEEL